jgi:hypothetical protein
VFWPRDHFSLTKYYLFDAHKGRLRSAMKVGTTHSTSLVTSNSGPVHSSQTYCAYGRKRSGTTTFTCGSGNSLPTEVMTASGLKPIATTAPGEQVLAYDEATGKIGYFTVTETMRHLDPVLVTLTVEGETILTTPEHPFYELISAPGLAVTQGEWTPVGELEVGDLVWQAAGSTGVVQAVEVTARSQVMYNLSVAEAHTFFVGNGLWLVHNQCAKGGTYRLIDPTTGETMYVGRTRDLSRRAVEHRRDSSKAHLDLVVDLQTDDYAIQRGREQMLYDQYHPPLNRIQPINPLNPRRQIYLDAAHQAMSE